MNIVELLFFNSNVYSLPFKRYASAFFVSGTIFSLIARKSSPVKPCFSSSRPTPHITWTKDGEGLAVTPRMKVKNFNKLIQIPKASFEDAGEYVCAAANKVGYIEHTITVRVKGETHLQKPSVVF